MKFFLLINVKIPTMVGILTFVSGKRTILGLSEPTKAKFLDILYIFVFKISCSTQSKKFYSLWARYSGDQLCLTRSPFLEAVLQVTQNLISVQKFYEMAIY